MTSDHSEPEAKRLIACVVATEVFDILKQQQPVNLERFVNGLDELPGSLGVKRKVTLGDRPFPSVNAKAVAWIDALRAGRQRPSDRLRMPSDRWVSFHPTHPTFLARS
jgi:hypothetical protein